MQRKPKLDKAVWAVVHFARAFVRSAREVTETLSKEQIRKTVFAQLSKMIGLSYNSDSTLLQRYCKASKLREKYDLGHLK